MSSGPALLGGGAGVIGAAAVEEAVGSTQVIQTLVGYLHMLADDRHTIAGAQGYRTALLDQARPISYERWIRVRFDPPFRFISGLRFWTPNLIIPDGWSLLWGTTDTYREPVNTISSIAVDEVPTSDPGAPNCGPAPTGTGTQHSSWIVLQARIVDFAKVEAGPMMIDHGAEADTPIAIEYRLEWSEG